MNAFLKFLLIAPPLFVAVILHEIAHGYVAERLGDPTARRMGRITLNPLVHIDPIMTIALPAILFFSGSPVLFGGAKPVPIDPRHFANPRRGMAIVAIAGPVMNFILAALCYLLILICDGLHVEAHLPVTAYALLAFWLIQGIIVNIVLGLFNLFPVPPLDGGRIAVGFLPLPVAMRLARVERFGIMIVFLLLYLGVIEKVLGPVVDFVASHLAGA